jgi:hypothetical protein
LLAEDVHEWEGVRVETETFLPTAEVLTQTARR